MSNDNPTYQELQNEIIKLKLELKIQDKMINTIPNPLFVKNKDFIYTNCNDAFASFLGLPKTKIINSSVYDIAPKELADKYQLADCELRDSAENQTYESRVKYADGTLHDILFHKANIIDDKNEFYGIVGIMLDITERKSSEQALQESEKQLIELNATKDKLFSIIAHDLRAPFSSILGFSELLIEDAKDIDELETEEYLRLINTTTKDTLVLLDNLLNWAKSQTGQIIFDPQKLILSSIIEETIKNSNSTAKIKNISLNHIQSDEFEIDADKNMLKTVLRNLISNAIKFTKPGGRITISSIPKQSQVEISVSDNGVGINNETLTKLFEIDTNTTTKGTAEEKGSGLGLLLCKEFVEKHKGKIWAESKRGEGSIFKFTLPLSTS
ncbi:PAS domain-containing sensor histidine kinase [Labilibaculum antarcticum]|uniref:histidine kinase n=1 Tax=Labilibaculum antarcticum TaxID=1717717 RepID=A0A1Y1CSD3_9BACT|nr:HAMP domain-containing sensor histidine kinase [Labilibaculum antarcticum]BAX82141.1 PAS domain S-box-containing protein [Labilibaculum antarcticum]